ncbi:MAG: cyclic nucleotide-binding domain-containing protein [Dehalococcoidia bacterium]|nr:cyclic nucleotide-binding domain-containing protein [Dehalococcoidia bacterium]
MTDLPSLVHQALSRSTLFRGLSPRQAEVVARSTEPVFVPAGSPLAEQDRPGPHCALIISGEASVERNGYMVGRLGEGDFFCLSGAATLVAEDACLLLIAADDAFRGLVEAIPAFAGIVLAAGGEICAVHPRIGRETVV